LRLGNARRRALNRAGGADRRQTGGSPRSAGERMPCAPASKRACARRRPRSGRRRRCEPQGSLLATKGCPAAGCETAVPAGDCWRLDVLGGADHLFEEIRLALPRWQRGDHVGKLRGMVGERQQQEPRLQLPAFMQNPSVLLCIFSHISDPGSGRFTCYGAVVGASIKNIDVLVNGSSPSSVRRRCQSSYPLASATRTRRSRL
jgi:hypothetical protein